MAHIYAWEPIAVIILAAIYFYMRRRNKRAAQELEAASSGTTPTKTRSAEDIYMHLRRRALETKPKNLGLETKGTEPFGLLMEMGIQVSVVTLACLVDGEANVYYKTGGGMVGGITHESVRNAAKAFVALAPKAVSKMTKTTDYPLPGPDRVRFYVLTPQGVFTTETSRQNLTNPKSELGALFYSGQEVVAEMRQVQEEKQGEIKKLDLKGVPGYLSGDDSPGPDA